MKPKRLFKYQQFKSYSLEAIHNQIFCFSSRRILNDSSELKFEYHFENEEEAKEFWTKISHGEGFSEEDALIVKIGLSVDFIRRPAFQQVINKMNKEVQEDLDKIGIYSLTENENDSYMWSEYAGDHTGFCLVLYPDYQHQFFREEMFKVDYSDEPTKIDLASQNAKHFQKVLFRKGADWKRENEWRIALPRMLQSDHELVKLDRIIEGVAIGKNMSLENEIAIRGAVPSNIEVYRNI